MRGKLTEDGKFIAERKTGFENLMCPYADDQCGTWCALFSEPITHKNGKFNRKEFLVNLCNGRYWKFTDFKDRRKSHGGNEEIKEE